MKRLDIQPYDPVTDTVMIEGIRYSGEMLRDHFGLRGMVGQILRIDSREDGVITVTSLPELKEAADAIRPAKV